MCGIENLEQALRPLPRVAARSDADDRAIFEALAALPDAQRLNLLTGAVHAAAACSAGGIVHLVREDVGRHNAFDKLIGAMLRDKRGWDGGFALLSSRCSFELVEKAVLAGCPLLATISAPTTLAIARAAEAGLALRVLVRPDALLVAPGPMSRILGAVLAGGLATRFGSDKAIAELDGRPLIDWVVSALAAHVDDIVICGRGGGLPDRPAGRLGPLAGLNAALHAGRTRGFDAVLSVPCDSPHLPADLLDRLRSAGKAAFIVDAPVVGLWPCSAADELDAHLAGRDRSMRGWARRVGAVEVRPETPILNVNRPEDLVRLQSQQT